MKIKKLLIKLPFYLLLAMLVMGVVNYILKPDMVSESYASLGFPEWLYYFNLIAKALGVLALLIPQIPRKVKFAAWIGIFYLLVLGLVAHLAVADGQFMGAVVGLALWVLATVLMRKKN